MESCKSWVVERAVAAEGAVSESSGDVCSCCSPWGCHRALPGVLFVTLCGFSWRVLNTWTGKLYEQTEMGTSCALHVPVGAGSVPSSSVLFPSIVFSS